MYISPEGIKEQLNTKTFGCKIRVLDTAESTNSLLKNSDDYPFGTLIVAKKQTCGRGRLGRSFWSPEGGVYFSVLYKPSEGFNPGKITSCVALSVCKAIEELTGLAPKIKWVNDIFLNGKKVCGILCEAITNPVTSHIDGVVIGVGINVEEISVPEELENIITSLNSEHSGGISKNALIAGILNILENQLSLTDTPNFIDEIRSRSCVLGKMVKVIKPTETYEAFTEDIDPNCCLIVKRGEERIVLSTGEISVRNM